MKKTKALLGGAALSLIGASFSRAAEHDWPAFPEKGFISGRSATVQDVNEGNAIFVAKLDDKVDRQTDRNHDPAICLLDE